VALQNAPYRAHLSTLGPQPLFLDILEQQLSGWLLEKRIDVEVRHDNDWDDGSRRFEVWHHERSHGRRDLQATLVEHDTANGDWRTEVLASSDGWVDVHVTNAQGGFVATPRLVRYLLQVMDLGDAGLGYVDGVAEIDVLGIPSLLSALEDVKRLGLIFVAGSSADAPGDLLSAYAQELPRWARQTYGLAAFVRLTPDATDAFAARAPSHAVSPWTIRTFYPGPVLGDSIDARRHKYLTTRSLADMPTSAVAKMLGNIARAQSLKVGDLSEVTRVRRAIERLQHEQLLTQLHEQAATALSVSDQGTIDSVGHVAKAREGDPHPRDERDLDALIREILGIENPTEESLRDYAKLRGHHASSQDALDRVTSQLTDQRDRIDQLEDERRQMTRLLEDDQLELAELQEELENRTAESAWLRRKFIEAGQFQMAYESPPPEPVDYPDGFEQLLARIRVSSGARAAFVNLGQALADGRVIFTGDTDVALGLDASDTLATAVRAAWDCLLVLADYVRARDESKHASSVSQYLEATPDGYRPMSPKRHSAIETKATMQQFGRHRIFPVPESVAAGGCVEMVSHFKLARIGMVSPRLYYLDNYSSDGMIYVGYIGPHLPNTQSN